MNRIALIVVGLFLAGAVVLAETPTPVLAPDPGDPPPYAPQISMFVIVAAVLCSSTGVLFAMSAHVQGRISRKKLIVFAGLLILMTWVGLILAMVTAPPSDEYLRWEEAHRKWKNKEVVGEVFGDEPSETELLAPDEAIVDPAP